MIFEYQYSKLAVVLREFSNLAAAFFAMGKLKLIKSVLKGDYMKIGEIISKSVIDEAISKSNNLEGLCTVLVTVVVGALVATVFSRKDAVEEKKVIK